MKILRQSRNILILGLLTLCVIIAAASYRTLLERGKIAACRDSLPCFQNLILDTLSQHGISEGFRLLRTIYTDTPSFRGECHPFTIRLTDALYARYPDYTQLHLTPEVVTCNYGFLQEYPRALLLATNDPEQAKSFCEYVGHSIGNQVPAAEAECYRGIGRGLPFIDTSASGVPEKMAASAVKGCGSLTSNTIHYRMCLSGLFNNIGRTEVAGGAGLSIQTDDPMHLCKIQTDPEVRARCFGNYKATVISMINIDETASAEKDIRVLYGANASTSIGAALWTLGYEWARKKLVAGDEFTPAIQACAALSAPFLHDCIRGISVGLAKHGAPGSQHILMTAFCKAARDSMPSLTAQDCPSEDALEYIRGFYAPEAFIQAYDSMRKVLGDVVDIEEQPSLGS